MTTATVLTPEIFEQACGGTIRAKFVTPEMIELATTILKCEAKDINATPACNWWQYETVDKIEAAVPRCKDRHVQAILAVAEVWGEDDYGIRTDSY